MFYIGALIYCVAIIYIVYLSTSSQIMHTAYKRIPALCSSSLPIFRDRSLLNLQCGAYPSFSLYSHCSLGASRRAPYCSHYIAAARDSCPLLPFALCLRFLLTRVPIPTILSSSTCHFCGFPLYMSMWSSFSRFCSSEYLD
jgi:hypothetical protein